MGATVLVSVLLSVAPPDSKVIEEMLLQLALRMYVDREANLLWAMAVMLAKEVFVLSLEYIWLLLWLFLLLLLWWLW